MNRSMFAAGSLTRQRAAGLALVALLTLATSASVAAQVVSDSTFLDANWSLTVATAGNGGSVAASQVASGGNPGAYRNVTDTLNAAPAGSQTVVLGTSIYTPFTYAPATSGAILSIAYSEDAACTAGCFGQGQSTGPAVSQGGNLYIYSATTFITGPGVTFANHALSGLTAADFSLVNVTPTTLFDTTQHPNFSVSGAPLQFGFFRANGTGVSGGGYTLAAGIDNWQITIATTPPIVLGAPSIIPTLGEWQLAFLALGVVLIGFAYARRRG